MRAFAFCLAASAALASCAAPALPAGTGGAGPRRIVSLNLCTDELLLALAAPEQIASVTHLSQRAPETPYWREARRHAANDGSLASAAPLRPDLVLTMGGGGDRLGIARRLGIAVVDLPYPQNLDDVIAATRRVAEAVGQSARGERLVRRLAGLGDTVPPRAIEALWIGGGGRTVAPAGLEAQWMALAGLKQQDVGGDRVELEHLLTRPPAVLLRSDYRRDQYSRNQSWLDHPLSRAARGSRTVATDGRRWTCMGPAMIEEVERLRRERIG